MLLRLARRVLFLPIWGLWKLYNGLWWAFADDPPAPDAAKDGAGEPVAVTNPETTLKWGFGTTLATSVLSGAACSAAFDEEMLRETTAWSLWAWITAVTAVASVIAVKKIARRQAELRASGWRGHVRATAAGFADMGRSACHAAAATGHAAINAGQRAARFCRSSCDAARRVGSRLKPSGG